MEGENQNQQGVKQSSAPVVVAIVATVAVVVGGVLLALAILKLNIEFLKDTPFSSARSESVVEQTKAEEKSKTEAEQLQAETKMTVERATEQLKSKGYTFIGKGKVYRDEGFENCGDGPDYKYLYFVVLNEPLSISAAHLGTTENYTMKTGILCKGDDFNQYEFTSKVQDFENCMGKDVVIGFKDGENVKLGTGGGHHTLHFPGVGTNSGDCVLYNYGSQVCHIKAYELVAID